MKKTLLLLVLLLMFLFPLIGEKVGVLAEIMKPDKLAVLGDRLYCLEGASIYIYSLKDLSLIRKFGNIGEGPGELVVSPLLKNDLNVTQDHVIINSENKVVFFNYNGKYLRETRVEGLKGLVLFKNRAIAITNEPDLANPKSNRSDLALCLFDLAFRNKKILIRQPLQIGKRGINLLADSLNFFVYDDKIFVEKSHQGFEIEVFDLNGKRLYSIRKEMKRIPVNDEYKQKVTQFIKLDPFIKMFGGWDAVKKRLYFSDYFPFIRDIVIYRDRIYLKTFGYKDSKDRFLITNLKGSTWETRYFFESVKPGLIDMMIGSSCRFYFFRDSKYYYLKENDSEEWELHYELL